MIVSSISSVCFNESLHRHKRKEGNVPQTNYDTVTQITAVLTGQTQINDMLLVHYLSLEG